MDDPATLTVIETERLVLRKLTREDLPWLIELRTAEPVRRYLGGEKWQNPEALNARIDYYIECHDLYGFGFCAMALRSTGELIGTSGLQPLEDSGEIEIGYNLAEKYWRQGFGYECAIAWLKFGFENAGLDKIVAVAHPDNTGSWRIMEKCGMRLRGSEEHYGIDCVVYEIGRDEFLTSGEES